MQNHLLKICAPGENTLISLQHLTFPYLMHLFLSRQNSSLKGLDLIKEAACHLIYYYVVFDPQVQLTEVVKRRQLIPIYIMEPFCDKVV